MSKTTTRTLLAFAFWLSIVLTAAFSFSLHVSNDVNQGTAFYLVLFFLIGIASAVSVFCYAMGIRIFKYLPDSIVSSVFGGLLAVLVLEAIWVADTYPEQQLLIPVLLVGGAFLFPGLLAMLTRIARDRYKAYVPVALLLTGLLLAVTQGITGYEANKHKVTPFYYVDPRINNPLVIAAKNGDLAEVKHLLGTGMNVNSTNDHGETALEWAASRGGKEMIQVLLSYGADPNQPDSQMDRPLSLASNREVVDQLIAGGADIAARYSNNDTLLHLSAARGDRDMIEFLISKGINVNSRNDAGRTPLHYAALALVQDSNNDVEVPVLLIMHGADANAKDKEGKTPFDLVAGINDEAISALFRPVQGVSKHGYPCRQQSGLADLQKKICFFPPLAELDRKLNDAYKAALKVASNPANVESEQRDWLDERNLKCGDGSQECPTTLLMSMYQLRATHLDKLAHDPKLNSVKDQCYGIANLASAGELKKLAISGWRVNSAGNASNSESAEQSLHELAQLKAIDKWSYKNPETVYELAIGQGAGPERFVSFFTGGSCASTQLFNLRMLVASHGRSNGWIETAGTEEDDGGSYWGGGDYPISYRGRNYIITADLADVNRVRMISSVQDDGTMLPMCLLKASRVEYQVKHDGGSVCSRIAKRRIQPLAWKDVSGSFLNARTRDDFAKEFGGYADRVETLKVDLGDDGHVENLARFTYESSAGCGSTSVWGRALSESSSKVQDGPLNDALLAERGGFEIYEDNHEHFLQRSTGVDREQVVRIRKGKVIPVCEAKLIQHYKVIELFKKNN